LAAKTTIMILQTCPNIILENGFGTFFKVKVILVTGNVGLLGCGTARLPHFLDHRLIDGGEVVSLKRRNLFTPRRFLVLISVRV
jgi:hypothetical protein